MFKKKLISHERFYISSFVKDEAYPYVIFIHGGPGLNCGVVEYLIEYDGIFDSLNFNIIFYDQRGCGRSSDNFTSFTHAENIGDLNVILDYLDALKINVQGAIGHSYGAKLLIDFMQKSQRRINPIFVSTSHSILTPRLNNIMLDLFYLKKDYPEKYLKVLKKMDNFDLGKMWEITEELAPFFQENKDRPYFYWANLDMWEKCKAVQNKINLPMNNDVFMNIRKDLYSDEAKFSVDITNLEKPYLWINGMHDYINGVDGLLSSQSNMVLFFQSAHYPHIEEGGRFCQIVNNFMHGENYEK